MAKKGEMIGRGSFRAVYEDAHAPNRVIKEYDIEGEPHKVLARAFLAKILHLLLPENFPPLHRATTRPQQMIVPKQPLDEQHRQLMELVKIFHEQGDSFTREQTKTWDVLATPITNDPRVQALNRFLNQQLGIKPDVNAVNYIFNDEGRAIYLDTIEPWEYPGGRFAYTFSVTRLREAIRRIQDTGTRALAERECEKLIKLAEEQRALYPRIKGE